MDDDGINKDFDDFLKKHYENHIIKPERALWEGINSRLNQEKIDIGLRKVRYLKVFVFSLAAIFVGTIITFFISLTEIDKTVSPSDTTNNNLLYVNNSQVIKTDSIINASGLISNQTGSVSGEIKIKKNKLTYNKIRESKEMLSTQKQDSELVNNFYYNNTISKRELAVNKIKEDITIKSSSFVSNSDSLKNLSFALMTFGIRDSSTMGINIAKALEKISIPIYIDTGLTGIMQLSQNSDQCDLKLSGLTQNLTQSGESRASKSGGKRLPFFIEGFVSPEISYRALAVNTQYSVPDYGKTYFNKKEKPDFTFAAGVSGGSGITDNIILRSGIFYSRYSLKFKTEAIYLLNTSPDGNLVYTSSGPVNLQLISSDSLSNESLLKSSLNFSYLNIPLIIELHFWNNYFINLGLNFNLLVGQNMNWQAENYDGNFSNATSKPIRGLKSNSISMILGLGTEKPVSHNLSIIVNPTLKVNLSSINNKAPVKSYPYSWGLNAGLRYYFN
jgi:hypothetical protein